MATSKALFLLNWCTTSPPGSDRYQKRKELCARTFSEPKTQIWKSEEDSIANLYQLASSDALQFQNTLGTQASLQLLTASSGTGIIGKVQYCCSLARDTQPQYRWHVTEQRQLYLNVK
jgi:hypothetical protein